MSDREHVYSFNKKSIISKNFTSMKRLLDTIESNTEMNTIIEVPVNRTGYYSVTVKAYDAYNNIFTNKDDDSCFVSTQLPDIDIIINSEYSDNKDDFHLLSKSGELILPVEKEKILNECDEYQKYPVNYPIFNPEHKQEKNMIHYDVISYATDTPKQNDYILLSNLTECVEKIVSRNSFIMKPNALNKQNIFIKDGLVDFVIFNDETNKIISEEKTAYKVSSFNKETRTINLSDELSDDIYNYLNNINDRKSPVNLYVLSANEIDLDDTFIQNDMENRTCSIISEGRDAFDKFNVDTVVKVSVTSKTEDNETVFDNQCAYRIIDKKLFNFKTDGSLKLMSMIKIDGNIDMDFIKSLNNTNIYSYESDDVNETKKFRTSGLTMKLKQLHSQAAIYTLRVDSDAKEETVKYYGNEYHTMTASFNYMDKQ